MNSLLITRSKICGFYLFSSFKNKFEKVLSMDCLSMSQFYSHLQQFENNLSHIEQLKLSKSITDLQKKVVKIKKKQTALQSYLGNQSFKTSITYAFFYGMDSQTFKPIDDKFSINCQQIEFLHERVVKSTFEQTMYSDFDQAFRSILSNPKVNIGLYQQLSQRCSHIQDQISLHAFQGFSNLLKGQKNQNDLIKQDKNMLNKLRDQKGLYTKDFKFTLNQNLELQESTKISEISKQIIKYGFESEKIKMLSLKSLSVEGKKWLSPQWLANHLFILAYHKIGVKQINQSIYNIFDMIKSRDTIRKEKICFIERMNSFLFYLLVNKLQNIDLFKDLFIRIVKQFAFLKQEGLELFSSTFDRELFYIMTMLLDKKHSINIGSINQAGDITKDQAELFRYQMFIKKSGQIESDSPVQFQKYLRKKQYTFSKSRKLSPLTNDQLFSQFLFCIEEKNWVCLNLSKIEKKSSKVNGVGELLLQLFKTNNIGIKIVNPHMVNNFEKGTGREQYFKSKLKGIKEPDFLRQRRFDF